MRPLAGGHPSVPAGPPNNGSSSSSSTVIAVTPTQHPQQEYQHRPLSQHLQDSYIHSHHPHHAHAHEHHRHSHHHSFPHQPYSAPQSQYPGQQQQHQQHQQHGSRQYQSSSSYDQLLSPPTSISSSLSAFSPLSSPLEHHHAAAARSSYPPSSSLSRADASSFPRSMQHFGHGRPETLVNQVGQRTVNNYPHQDRYSYIPPPLRRPLLQRDPDYHDQHTSEEQQQQEQQQQQQHRRYPHQQPQTQQQQYGPSHQQHHQQMEHRSPPATSERGPQGGIPPPIRTRLTTMPSSSYTSSFSMTTPQSSSSSTCPLSSGHTISSSNSTGHSPATPRTLPNFSAGGSILHSPPLMDSPLDYRDNLVFRTSLSSIHTSVKVMPMPCRRQGDGDDEGMEHCSEQDDGFDMKKIPSPLSSRKSSKKSQSGQTLIEDGHMDLDADLSMSSSRLTESLVLEDEEDEDDRPTQPAKKIKVSRKRFSQGTSSFGDVLDQIEEEENTGAGIQSFSGSGLRIYAQRVCERVESKGSTSYNQLVHELCGGTGDPVEGAPEIPGQENIRRRVYDALNVLEALGVISMDNKDIRWIGIQESTVINEISRRIAISVLQTGGGGEPPEHPGDDESEEPEDDEMEIEKLQREVEALRMGNELELAQFKDQAAKHVQVLNLVKRNKRREEKEQEKEERRRQRKEEKRAARALAATSSGADQDMTDVGPQGCSDDHSEEPQAPRQRRSSRQPSETPSVSRRRIRSNTDAAMAEVDDSEEAALRKEQERKERRERKEKRAQRRQQREAQNVQLPFVMVQMDGYTGQSSDSEGGISVVRRVREEPKSRSSGKSKRSGQSTATVEISIPQQEELSIISDTEVLAELGLDSVPMEQLRSCFSVEAIQTIAPGVDVNSHGLVSMRGGHERALLHRADSSRQ